MRRELGEMEDRAQKKIGKVEEQMKRLKAETEECEKALEERIQGKVASVLTTHLESIGEQLRDAGYANE